MRILLAFVGLLLVALPNLPWPMHGDQILFLQGAESLHRGELLYRDFWDLKQPGIIVAYYLGGQAFGFHEWGLHVAEVLFWCVSGLFLAWAWPRLQQERSWSVWPIITIPIWYFAVTSSMQHAQVETLIGPLLFLHWWLLWGGLNDTRLERGGWLFAGVVAAVVLLFKFMFAPLLAVACLHGLYRRWPVEGTRITFAATGLYVLGGVVVFALAFFPWVVTYEKGELWRTFIVYPQQMMRELPEVSPQRLWDSTRWFGARFGPLVLLAFGGAIALWRRGQRELVVVVAAWLVASGGLIYIQKQSWWSYHFMLLLVPLGLWAAEGCRALACGPWWQRVLLGSLLLPVVVACGLKYRIWAKYDFPTNTPALQEYYRGEDTHYQEAFTETAFLHEPSALPGPIFVAGEPVYYRAANRIPATAIHGWSMELYIDPVRARLTSELERSACAYVFLNRSQADLIAERYPALMAWLAAKYRVVRQSEAGTWYERNE